jgi:DNA-binding GntR family transcriptional regulator
MTLGGRDDAGAAGAAYRPASAAVLADRMAAALVHHEPGWRLPRLTALARRYSVSTAEVDAAIDELAARHLVRRLPDGQVYRASPAEYWVPLEGVFGLASHVDPMGGQITCKSRNSSRRRPPEDIGRSLGLAPGEPAVAVRCLWTVGGEPGALSASYLAERFATAVGELPAKAATDMVPVNGTFGLLGSEPLAEQSLPGAPAAGSLAGELPFPRGNSDSPRGTFLFPWGPEAEAAARPAAVQIEMGLPPPSAARSLRMTAGEPVATVTITFADPTSRAAVALTMAMLRPELFRVVLAVPGAGNAEGFRTTWTHAEGDWEP